MEIVFSIIFEVIISGVCLLIFYAIFCSLFIKDKKPNNKLKCRENSFNIPKKEENAEDDPNQYKYPWELTDDSVMKSRDKHQKWLLKIGISGGEKYTDKKSRYTYCWHCTHQINNTLGAECTVCGGIICPYCGACFCGFFGFN